ncbi:MAG: NAD(P)-dependent oxidoreductase [Candidatus Marinimicrobia bacterium]|jgi:nucleoside-diphosphate-sugar epimerase|nr:NAD(P)-dependent oxidoreductase [Candidatus Neomarinimicrobiota bacterium]MBT6672885.1 NAD(P)-dependent oxidoreductase [Lentimicrobiaceae bacterium]
MKIMVTGDQGYIGAVLVPMLMDKGYEVIGYDAGFFSENLLQPLEENYQKIKKDIRDIEKKDLNGVDVIIHLAGLSNDPLGAFLPKLTEDINYTATMRLAELAKESGVSRFVYASSQSMYGISDTSDELDEDDSDKNPITAYAIAKWNAEQKLHAMSTDEFVVTSFRPSTVFGASPRLRCDIVFNNLVACAYTTGRIEIMSDGTPWRPIVHIRDVCSAFIAGVEAPAALVSGRAFNVGVPNGNFTVRDIAEAAQRAVPGCELIFTGEHADSRTYKVSFSRILNELKEYYKPEWDLDMGGKELIEFFDEVDFNENQFRGRDTIRIEQLKHQVNNNIVGSDFRYKI